MRACMCQCVCSQSWVFSSEGRRHAIIIKVKFPVKFRLCCNMWCQIHWSLSEFFILFNRRALAYYGNFQNWQNVDVYVWLCLQESEDGSCGQFFFFASLNVTWLQLLNCSLLVYYWFLRLIYASFIVYAFFFCAFRVEKRGRGKKQDKTIRWGKRVNAKVCSQQSDGERLF